MNKFLDLIKETRKGKTIGRTLFNWKIRERTKDLKGAVVDLGSGKNASYKRYIMGKPEKIINIDINPDTDPEIIADINKTLPLPDGFADAVFLFSVVYILENPEEVLKEIRRILKFEGRFLMSAPFIFNEAKEPADYWRFTSSGIYKLLRNAGFKNIEIEPVGERFTAAAYLTSFIFVFWPVKFLLYILAISLDKLMPDKMKLKQPAPIGYFVTARK